MLEKLRLVEERYMEMEERAAQPDFYADPKAATKLLKEQKQLEPIIKAYRAYKAAEQAMAEARELMDSGEPIFILLLSPVCSNVRVFSKLALFAKGSPARKDSPGRGRWHESAERGAAGIAQAMTERFFSASSPCGGSTLPQSPPG